MLGIIVGWSARLGPPLVERGSGANAALPGGSPEVDVATVAVDVVAEAEEDTDNEEDEESEAEVADWVVVAAGGWRTPYLARFTLEGTR